MAVVDLKHPAAETDDSSLDFISDVVRAIDPDRFEVRRWELMVAEYRRMGLQYLATQRAVERIFETMLQLD